MVCVSEESGVVNVAVYPDLLAPPYNLQHSNRSPSQSPSLCCHSSCQHHHSQPNTMTIVDPYSSDVVVVRERGLAGGCLVTAMSGLEQPPPKAASSPQPSQPLSATPHTAQAPTDNIKDDPNAAIEGPQGQVGRGRRKLENEDSSYDSDFEPCEWTPASPRPDDDQHEDVYRTHSDTLGAEFAEYVTLEQPISSSSSVVTAPTTSPLVTSTSITTIITSTPAALTTTTSSTAASISTCSSTASASITAITTCTTITTTSSAGPPAQEAVRAASPAVRLSVGPPAVSVTPPAPPAPPTTSSSTSTLPAVTLTQPPAAPCTSPSTPTTPTTSSTTSSGSCAGSGTAGESGSGVSWVVQQPGYASQVEFGVKLGYSETHVQIALDKLGGTPDKDELLHELIRLGTTVARPDGDADAGDDVADIKDEAEHQQQQQQQPALKPIIIDGSNVAMSHGNKTTFSCRGLRVCVDWFRARGHTEITVFVPAWRKEAPRPDTPIADQELLLELERENVLVFTPSRVCGGKRIVSYDDRYILNEAVTSLGVVVSNDNYRDLAAESQAFRRVIEESLLMYSWVKDRFVPPDDPLGRNGPTLDVFLRRSARDRQAPCPYGRKCTYGNKCKYLHPERGAVPLKSVTERLQEQAQRHYQNKAKSRDSSPGEGLRGKSLSLPVGVADSDVAKKPLARTQSTMPAVSLSLPTALTQETPTHDMVSNTSTSTTSHSHHHLMPPQLESRPIDPIRSSTMYKGDSSPYHLYPSQGPQASYGSSTWGWKGQNTEMPMRSMPNLQGAPPQSQPPNFGSHLPISKQHSDPDPATNENPHRKLQRQLTLNPAYDSRLYKIVGFREPAPELFIQPQQQPHHQQPTGQGSPSRSMKCDNETLVYQQGASGITGRISPGYSSPYGSREQLSAVHPPLARHGSSQEGTKHMTSLPAHLYPTYSHPNVTRFASAPDPIWGGHHQQAAPGPPHITRLNSTSDTRLNVYSCGSESQYFPEVFDDQMGRLPPFHPMSSHHSASPGPGAPSPGPIGSRPMSPQQTSVLHHSPSLTSRQHLTSQQHLALQQPQIGLPPSSFSSPISGAASHEDARLRVFYHLSNIFQEAQVRAVLAMYPEETDPLKIISYLVAPTPGPVGSRPMSPQQPSQSGVGHQSQGVPVRGSSPLTTGFSSPLPSPASSHEDARLRAFYHLSQLFPEAQVRAVLARYPDETDAQQLCATLLGLSGNQS